MEPLVSILLPSYNHEKFISKTIESILAQTYQNFELIITDDGSTDDSLKEIEKFADSRIKIYRFSKNKGALFAYENCINHAQGKYIANLSSDDTWEHTKLAKQVRVLEDNPDIECVFSYASIINEEGTSITDETHYYLNIFNKKNRDRFGWLNFFFYNGNCFCHPSLLARRTNYENIIISDKRMRQLPDFNCWIKMLMTHEFYIIEENLVNFRIRLNEANTSGNTLKNNIRQNVELLEVYKNYLTINTHDKFKKTFPNANYYNIISNETSNVHFNISLLALEAPIASLKLFGIQELYTLYSDTKILNDLVKTEFDFTFLQEQAGKIDFSNLSLIASLTNDKISCDLKISSLENKIVESSIVIEKYNSELKKSYFNKLIQRLRIK